MPCLLPDTSSGSLVLAVCSTHKCTSTRGRKIALKITRSWFPGHLTLILNIPSSNHGDYCITFWPTEVRMFNPHSLYVPRLTRCSALQRRAVENARLAFSRLPGGDATFRWCVGHPNTVADVVKEVTQRYQFYKEKRSTRLLERFQQHTLWLQNISGVVDIAVQTQAGIGCPLWAPIKFVLIVRHCIC